MPTIRDLQDRIAAAQSRLDKGIGGDMDRHDIAEDSKKLAEAQDLSRRLRRK